MTTISQALELVREKFGTEKAEWCDALEKTVHSKNITVSDWNFLVEKLSVVSSGIDGFFEVFDAIVEAHRSCVPDMDVLDRMMFEKYGNDERPNPDYFFSKINWNLLLKFNRAYVHAYDGAAGEFSISFGNEDGTGVYALKAISRYGGALYVDEEGNRYDTMVPRNPWMSKSKWISKWREAHPGNEEQFSDEEIVTQYSPRWTDYELLGTLVERRPDGHIRIPKGFSYADGATDQLATSKHYVDTGISNAITYVDNSIAHMVGNINNSLESKLTRKTIASTDSNRYVYTQSYKQTSDGIELMQIGQNTAPANSIARRTADGTLRTSNPKEPLDCVNLRYLNGVVGDISTALDELHAYAEALINGGGAQ